MQTTGLEWIQLELKKERTTEVHKAALQRAKTFDVPHAYTPESQYGTFDEEGEESSRRSQGESSFGSTNRSTVDETWDEMIERLFDKDEHGHILLMK